MAAKPNAFDRLKQHVPKQKSKKTAPKEKKKYKLSKTKILEQKFQELSLKQKNALCDHMQSPHFGTFATTFLNIQDCDIQLLKEQLSIHLDDKASDDIFKDKAPSASARFVKQLWGEKSTFKAYTKRNILLELDRNKCFGNKQQEAKASYVIKAISKARLQMSEFRTYQKMKRYKTANNKISSDEDILKDIERNQSGLNRLSDQLLTVKHRISNQKVKLKLEAQNLGNCLITLGLVKLNADGKHIQTKQRTITGSMEPKAPALCAVFEHVTLDLETQISECDNKNPREAIRNDPNDAIQNDDMNNTNNDNTSNENTNTENSNNNNNGNINEPSNEHERYSQLEPYEDDSSSDSESHDSSSYTESSSDSESEDEKKEHKQICVRCKAPKPPQHLVNAAVGVVWLKCPRCDGYIHWECVLSLDFVPRDKVWLCGICTKARY
eukprot:809115_1